ncbi:type I-E CRISPR-associated protein Cse2/CasB [Streptomyces sp. NPDC054784]
MSTEPSAPPSASGWEKRRARRAAFTQHMEKLCREDPGARNALRFGLRRNLNDAQMQRLHRIVVRWLPRHRYVSMGEERAYYTVAALIADRPRHTFAEQEDEQAAPESEQTQGQTAAPVEVPQAAEAVGAVGGREGVAAEPAAAPQRWGESFGCSLAKAVTAAPHTERVRRASAAERRLDLLTRQSTEGLHRHLPAAVRQVREAEVNLDWVQLLDDLSAWPEWHGRIARRWLQDYHRHVTPDPMEPGDEEQDTGGETAPAGD